MKVNRKWLLLVALVLSVAMATTGTLAYLTDEDADVNTMVLGKVEIVQNESQRVVNEDGTYPTDTIDGVESYLLEEFKQDKPLLPIVGDPHATDGITASYDDTIVRMTQIGSYGSMQVFAGKNAVDKFVTVTNTGKTDAFVRTFVAIEIGDLQERSMIGASYHTAWTRTEIGTVEIDGNNYFVYEFNYPGAELSDGTYRHENGVLPAGDTTYPSLCQVYLSSKADNEHVEAIDGNGNGKLDILVLSQAIQADGFEGLAPEGQTDSEFALNEGFGEPTPENIAKWYGETEVGSPGEKWPNNNPPSLVKVENPPADTADVSEIIVYDISTGSMSDQKPEELDCYYIFTATETAEEAAAGEFADWEADYVVSFDKNVPAGAGGLAGNYAGYGWIGLVASNDVIPANEEFRLLTMAGSPWTYPDICKDVQVFKCGAFDYNDALVGTTLTVKLCLFDPVDEENVIVVSETKYTFTDNDNNIVQ